MSELEITGVKEAITEIELLSGIKGLKAYKFYKSNGYENSSLWFA